MQTTKVDLSRHKDHYVALVIFMAAAFFMCVAAVGVWDQHLSAEQTAVKNSPVSALNNWRFSNGSGSSVQARGAISQSSLFVVHTPTSDAVYLF